MKFRIPELSLVVLIGPSGAGKSTFAAMHFSRYEVLSSDYCRALVSDNENDQSVTAQAFDVLHYIAARRLENAKLTVVDATNVQNDARKPLVELARKYHCLPVAIVFDLPERVCQDRNRERADRDFGPHVIAQQKRQLRSAIRSLEREGFRHVFVLKTPEDVEQATISRDPLYNNLRGEHGPFDIIGDVHGCYDELAELLHNLGYEASTDENGGVRYTPPPGRKAVFVGDLVDRGPGITSVLRTVMQMVKDGTALCVPGNHDIKLMRKLRGKNVQITHGLADSVAQLAAEPPEFADQVAKFIDGLVSHYVLDDGKLVVAHAGMKQEMQGRGSGRVREFALYGETTGETDEFGLPIRYNWAAEYRGPAMVVYGHTPVPEPEWLNRTMNIDTGCVFGGALTALRYPERELVSVPAKKTYAEPARPFLQPEKQAPLTAQQEYDDLLEIEDVIGKRIIETRLHRTVTIRQEQSIAALEVMSRFAANPKWLIYLPPTMSPSETSFREGYLEYPTEAFTYFRSRGIGKVVCEEKHMGSRSVVVLCRDEEVARKRFGIDGEGIGVCLTRTGRRFFNDAKLESEFLASLANAVTAAGLWDEFDTGWFCFDCELMPWSAKAVELLRLQYAATASAAHAAFEHVLPALNRARERGVDMLNIPELMAARSTEAGLFRDAYRRYCWPVESARDYRIAPFHVLASEHGVHTSRDHVWHMETIKRLVSAGEVACPTLTETPYHVIDLSDPASEETAAQRWEELTGRGGEGMVIKPLDFITTGKRGLLQPALKCRGREYLRIIYGPHYTEPQNLERLRNRGLATKRSLALREFALGIEALERFVRREPLRRVHECVFGVLALESEAVDPRL
jgi:protein phosphatase